MLFIYMYTAASLANDLYLSVGFAASLSGISYVLKQVLLANEHCTLRYELSRLTSKKMMNKVAFFFLFME